MITRCSNQDLQSTLLERERASAPLDAATAEHLAACEACQVASERLRRMSSVWMADQVEDAAIAAAEMRFHAREHVRDEPKLWLGAMPFAGMGAVAGILLLVAARSMGPSHHVTPAATPAPVAVHSEHAVRKAPRRLPRCVRRALRPHREGRPKWAARRITARAHSPFRGRKARASRRRDGPSVALQR